MKNNEVASGTMLGTVPGVLDCAKVQDEEIGVATPESGAGELPLPERIRALLAELVGTMMIVLFGVGSVISTFSGVYSGIWQVSAVWGFGVALAIYCTADASGAHLNPAMTLAFLLVRPKAQNMTVLKAAQYTGAQLAGGIIGGALNLGIYRGTIVAFERANGITRGEPESIKTACGFGAYFPNPGLNKEYGGGFYSEDDVTAFDAMCVEAWCAFVLAFIVFGLTNERNKIGLGPGTPLMIGLAVAVLVALYAPITMAAFNPARDFGPRIVASLAGWGSVAIPGPRNGFWVYIVGPLIGAPCGAYCADFVLWRSYPAKER